MKNLIALSLLFCGSIQSSFATMNSTMALEVQKIQNIECLNDIEDILVTVTHPTYLLLVINPMLAVSAYYASSEAKAVILANLTTYQTVIKKIKFNLSKGISNDTWYTAIKASLKSHEHDTVLGIEVGKTIVSCVRPHLNFTGTTAQQYAMATAALNRITALKAAINK
jgi:hypothetical protein